MIKEQEMLEKELKENFEKDIDTIRNHITSLRLIGVGLSNTLNEKDEEIERLNNIINELEKELKEDYKIWMCNSRSNGKSVKFGIDVCKTHFYNRLQELKGSDK